MLAKNYQYIYEAVLSVVDSKKNRKITDRTLFYKELYYPIYNAEQILEKIDRVKRTLSEEVLAKIDRDKISEQEIGEYLAKRWKQEITEVLETLTLKIVTETGYKEEFVWDKEDKQAICFDLASLCRVNCKKVYLLRVDEISIMNKIYAMKQLAPKALQVSFK